MRVLPFAEAPACAPARRRGKVRVQSSAETDEALLSRVARADRQAFAQVFSAYAPKVKGYLIRLGASAAAAEDLMQDAMLSVWRRAASYDPAKAKASPWIFVIARNAWIDKLRREKVELAYRSALPVSEESADEAPDDSVIRSQTDDRISAALETLSPEQRQAVQLAFFEDRPHSEVAERLSLPLGTVKSRLRLALIKLRAHWEQLE